MNPQPDPAPAPNASSPAACASEPLPQPPPALLNSVDPAAQALACLQTSAPVPSAIDSAHLPVSGSPRKARRNGRVACLPHLQRDMVNRMIWNSVPYRNIVAALENVGFSGISERNISNWASGGYLEWSLTQEQALEYRLEQDHLLDFLRRDDAPELPEVGLQAAATRLSQVLLQKLAHADDPEAHVDNYSKLVDLLCRLNREIAGTQDKRDESRRKLGRHADPDRVRAFDQRQAAADENFYSAPPDDVELPQPPATPFLPPEPTAELLAQQDLERDQERRDSNLALLRTALTKSKSANSSPPEQVPSASNNSQMAPTDGSSPVGCSRSTVGHGNPR